MTTRISLVRHAHVYNPNQVVYGRLPGFRLSHEGHAQALATAEALRHATLAAVWSSPMLRARQTAKIILQFHPSLPLRISSFLAEVYTKFQVAPNAELEARDWDFYSTARPPYEREIDVLNRMLRFLIRTRRQYADCHVVAVTHGDPISFVILWAFGLPITGAFRERLAALDLGDCYPATGSITTLTWQTSTPAERPQVKYLRPY